MLFSMFNVFQCCDLISVQCNEVVYVDVVMYEYFYLVGVVVGEEVGVVRLCGIEYGYYVLQGGFGVGLYVQWFDCQLYCIYLD